MTQLRILYIDCNNPHNIVPLLTMRYSLASRLAASFLACIVFLSTTSFSVDVHYCQNKMKGISFFGIAKSCHDSQILASCTKAKKSCHHAPEYSLFSDLDNCCQNKNILIEKFDLRVTSPIFAKNAKLRFRLSPCL